MHSSSSLVKVMYGIILLLQAKEPRRKIESSHAKPNPNLLPTQLQLSRFATNLLNEPWEKVLISLGLSKGDIYKHKEENRYNAWAQCYYSLVQWKQRRYKQATIENLVSACQECNTDRNVYEFLLK